jgi:hypothetical protein
MHSDSGFIGFPDIQAIAGVIKIIVDKDNQLQVFRSAAGFFKRTDQFLVGGYPPGIKEYITLIYPDQVKVSREASKNISDVI